jgi:hypothetical protein
MFDIIENLPTNAKSSVLYSLVGSLNASILYNAQSIVRACDHNGDDVREEICTDFPKTKYEASMAAELGNQPNRWDDLVAMVTLRGALHDLLMAERNTVEDVLPLHSTLKFLTATVKDLPKAQLDELIKSLAIDGLKAEDITTMYRVDAEAKRQDLFGMSERVLSVALALPTLDGEYEDNAFNLLSPAKQNNLWLKVEGALNKARNNIILGVLQRRAVDMGDIPLITYALKEVQTNMRNLDDGRTAA